MATTTALNLHCLSSSSSSSSLAYFQIPTKRAQFSCLARNNTTLPLHPIHLFTPQLGRPVGSRQKTEVADRNLTVAKAAEVAAPTSDKAGSSSLSKSSKKGKATKYPRRLIDIYQILKTPVVTEAAIKIIGQENSLVFTVDARADKNMIKEAFTNFFDVKVRKVNTSIRPDGTKKAYIMLSKEYNASDIAKSIGIFPGGD